MALRDAGDSVDDVEDVSMLDDPRAREGQGLTLPTASVQVSTEVPTEDFYPSFKWSDSETSIQVSTEGMIGAKPERSKPEQCWVAFKDVKLGDSLEITRGGDTIGVVVSQVEPLRVHRLLRRTTSSSAHESWEVYLRRDRRRVWWPFIGVNILGIMKCFAGCLVWYLHGYSGIPGIVGMYSVMLGHFIHLMSFLIYMPLIADVQPMISERTARCAAWALLITRLTMPLWLGVYWFVGSKFLEWPLGSTLVSIAALVALFGLEIVYYTGSKPDQIANILTGFLPAMSSIWAANGVFWILLAFLFPDNSIVLKYAIGCPWSACVLGLLYVLFMHARSVWLYWSSGWWHPDRFTKAPHMARWLTTRTGHAAMQRRICQIDEENMPLDVKCFNGFLESDALSERSLREEGWILKEATCGRHAPSTRAPVSHFQRRVVQI